MKSLIYKICYIFISACNKKTHKLEREGEPDIYTIQQDDAEMNKAIATAKENLHIFKNVLEKNNTGCTSFNLKVRFKTPDRYEHIWVSDISLRKNTFYGVIGNLPAYLPEIKLGDTISIKNEDITDWMFLDGNKLHGGYTIQVLRNRMTEEERDEFDKSYGISF